MSHYDPSFFSFLPLPTIVPTFRVSTLSPTILTFLFSFSILVHFLPWGLQLTAAPFPLSLWLSVTPLEVIVSECPSQFGMMLLRRTSIFVLSTFIYTRCCSWQNPCHLLKTGNDTRVYFKLLNDLPKDPTFVYYVQKGCPCQEISQFKWSWPILKRSVFNY